MALNVPLEQQVGLSVAGQKGTPEVMTLPGIAALAAPERVQIQQAVEAIQLNQGQKALEAAANKSEFDHQRTWLDTSRKQMLTGVDVVTGDKVARAGEQVELDRVNARMQLLLDFDEQGYDGMPARAPMTAAARQAELRTMVTDSIRTNPLLLAVLEQPAGSGIIPVATVERVLRENFQVKNNIVDRLNNSLRPDQIPGQADADILTAERAINTKTGERTTKDTQRTARTTERANAVTDAGNATMDLNDFDTDHGPLVFASTVIEKPAGMGGGLEDDLPKAGVIAKLLAIPKVGEYQVKLDELADAQRDADARPQNGAYAARVNTLRGQISALRISTDPTGYPETRGEVRQAIAEYDRLTRERNRIQARIDAGTPAALQRFDDAIATLTTDITNIDTELAGLTANRDRLVADRQGLSQDFHRDVDRVLRYAVQEALLGDSTGRTTEYIAKLNEIKTADQGTATEAETRRKEEIKANLVRHLDTRWKKTVAHWYARRPILEVDADKARAELTTIMDPTNPNAFRDYMRGLLTTANPTATNTEIDSFINDKTFMDQQQTDVPARLLRATATRRKLDEREVLAIADTSWGEAALNKWFEDQKMQELLDKARQRGFVRGGGGNMVEGFKRAPRPLQVALILAGLGLIGAPAALTVMGLMHSGVGIPHLP